MATRVAFPGLPGLGHPDRFRFLSYLPPLCRKIDVASHENAAIRVTAESEVDGL